MRRFLSFPILALALGASLSWPSSWPEPIARAPQHQVFLPLAMRSVGAETVELRFEFSQVLQPGQDTRPLAVAFHSIQYIDGQASPLGSLTFGTLQANALQGEGWFGNEADPSVGTFQWAGGWEKEAVLQLPLPAGTEGLLLHINSITDGLWMTVRLNGAVAAQLPVDAYWHQGYVPVGAATQGSSLLQEPQWIQNRYFPRFSAGRRLYAIRLRTALVDWNRVTTPDWRISSSLDTQMALTLVCMQGVINRHGAEVFFDWEDDGAYRHPSRYWLSLLRDHVDVVELDLDSMSAFSFLLRRYASRFNGAVLYDPQVPDTINLATMLAGLENRLVLAPEQAALWGVPDVSAATDLRSLARDQSWDTTEGGKYRLYQWVYQQLWPRLDRRVVGLISPGPPTSREIAGVPGLYYPLGLPSRDYIVALKLSALWLSPLDEPQASLFAQFVQEADSTVPLFGNFANDEVGTTALASRNGDWNAAFTIGNSPLAVGNMTVLSAIRPDLVQYRAEIDAQQLLDSLDDRPVLTLWSSDGDSIIYQTDRGFHGGVDFYWEGVQGHRFGWTTNPTLVDLAPVVWNDYVTNRSEVGLISGLSGCGYVYPALMSEAQLRAYLENTARYLHETGLRVLHVSNRFGDSLHALPDWVVRRYWTELGDSGYLGSFAGLSGWPWGVGFYYADAPSPIVPPSYVLRPTNAAAIQQDLLARESGEYRVDLTAPYPWQENATGYPWHRGVELDDPDARTGRALRFSRSDGHPPGVVVWGPFSALAPGAYRVSYRLKVAERHEARSIAHIFVGTGEGGTWRTLVERSLAPRDFARAGEYQDLELSLTLSDWVNEVEFRINYHGGEAGNWASTDLSADYIVARRQGGLDLPVSAAAFIALVGPVDPLDDSMQITRDFESAGGLVLTPDEFMAMLNPAFMIEWAMPRLGTGHPALVEASNKMQAGDYLESLLAVRQGLRQWRDDRTGTSPSD